MRCATRSIHATGGRCDEKISFIFAAGAVCVGAQLCGCAAEEEAAQQAQGKTFVFGDTTFNAENGEPDINPHRDNSGWACIRYGVGETLLRFTDEMQLEPGWRKRSRRRMR